MFKTSRQVASKHLTGMTLIELLVICAIVAILMTILLPALARAKSQAITVVCLSNLRQCAIATNMYTNDWSGCFPYPVSSAGERYLWYNSLDRYLAVLTKDSTVGISGRSYVKQKNCPIWSTIPSSPSGGRSGVETLQQFSRTFKMNSNMRRSNQYITDTSFSAFAEAGDIDSPERFALYADAIAYDVVPFSCNEIGRFSISVNSPSSSTTLSSDADAQIALRHRGGANVVFADGHAATFLLPTLQYRDRDNPALRLYRWGTEFVIGGTSQEAYYGEIDGHYDLTDSHQSHRFQRNPAMPIEWSIPGVLFH